MSLNLTRESNIVNIGLYSRCDLLKYYLTYHFCQWLNIRELPWPVVTYHLLSLTFAFWKTVRPVTTSLNFEGGRSSPFYYALLYSISSESMIIVRELTFWGTNFEKLFIELMIDFNVGILKFSLILINYAHFFSIFSQQCAFRTTNKNMFSTFYKCWVKKAHVSL